ncbi:MAG: aldose 1-epimerase family protein [Ruminococcus sp.]|nr:aldose 1-epimerase family protein [Candidatus Copronaster equi]
MYTLENDKVSIAIKEMGAELSSFKSKESGIEYLWQGNPDVWSGQSPILFPIVGTVLDNKFRVDGKEYEMGRHGIARRREFTVKEQGENYLVLTQSYNDDSLKQYPYKYNFDIKYELNGKKLTVTHTISSDEDKTMYFSIGAHPGFNCKIGDYIEFAENETLVCEKIAPDAILDGKFYPTLKDEKVIEITKDVFIDDALILSGMKSDTLYLKSNFRPQYIKFNFGKAPYLGLWAKPGAEYVCIEPWHGINDSHDKKDDFSQKRAIEKIEPGESFVFPWSAEIIE